MEGLDKVGCEYGRKNRELIQKLTVKSERLAVKCDVHNGQISELGEEMAKLNEKLDSIQAKLSWMLGAAIVAGTVASTLLSIVLTHILK